MKKTISLVLCAALIFCSLGSIDTSAAELSTASSIVWEYADEMDGNSRTDEITAAGIATAIAAYLGGLPLAKKVAAALVAYMPLADWATDETVVYYTVEQYRGLKYGGAGGYDTYYLKQVMKIYSDKSRTNLEKTITKTMSSISPLRVEFN